MGDRGKGNRTNEFQIMERSLIPTSFHVPKTRLSSLTPCESDSCVRKTAASFCIAFCMSNRISLVCLGPSLVRTASSAAMESRPAS